MPRLWQVQDLEAQLKEKMELYSELLLRKEELERNLEQQQVQTLELQQLTSQLEKELQAKTRIEDELRQVRVVRGADRCVSCVAQTGACRAWHRQVRVVRGTDRCVLRWSCASATRSA